jgi:hypothetical protein
MTIWYIWGSFRTFFSGLGIMYQESSGSPVSFAKTNGKKLGDRNQLAAVTPNYCQRGPTRLDSETDALDTNDFVRKLLL